MSSPFSELSIKERSNILNQISDLLKESGLSDATVKLSRQTVCALGADKIEEDFAVSVEKKYPNEKQNLIDSFKEKAKDLVTKYQLNIGLECEVGEGQQYVTIEDVTKIETPEEVVNLEHKEGEVWLLDFWATWCPPCQAPMAHNQEMLDTNSKTWKDKVRIIGLSIDRSAESVVKHVGEKNWKSVEHYWRAHSKCSDIYNIRGVPCVMLIDKSGKIVFKGHPASRPNLEKDLNDLVEGKELVSPNEEEAKESEESESIMVDSATIHAEIDDFKVKVGPELQTELKENVKNFYRAYCVMVAEEEISPETGKSKTTYDNYRVLVGPKDELEKVKEHLEAKVKGSFKVVLREQALSNED